MRPNEEDYEKTYAEFWRDIVENEDGTLNRDQVMRELSDYHQFLSQVAQVYCHITGGRISKANTLASAVLGEYQERAGRSEAEAVVDALQDLAVEIGAETAAYPEDLSLLASPTPEAARARILAYEYAARLVSERAKKVCQDAGIDLPEKVGG